MDRIDDFDIHSTVIDLDLFNDLVKNIRSADLNTNTILIEKIIHQPFFSKPSEKRMKSYDALESIIIIALFSRDFHFQQAKHISTNITDEISSYIDSLLYPEYSEIHLHEIMQVVREIVSTFSIICSDTVVLAVEAWLTWVIYISEFGDAVYMRAA